MSCCAALRDEDLREAIAGIRCPVLCIAGSADPATPPEALHFIHERIAGSKMVLLDAAHLTNVEQDRRSLRRAEFLGSPKSDGPVHVSAKLLVPLSTVTLRPLYSVTFTLIISQRPVIVA